MFLTIASWNMAGTSLLRTSAKKRAEKHRLYHKALKKLIDSAQPDIILLQEIVRYDDINGQIKELIDIPDDYFYMPSTTIDTHSNSYPPKWNKIRKDGDWDKKTYLGHGLGIMWRKTLAHSSLWSIDDALLHTGAKLEVEVVRFESGLFTGSRDTEPRMAMVAHFNINGQDFFIINVHLTTLKGEREGFPEKDQQGSLIRQKQIDTLLNGIISRLNHDRQSRFNRLKQKTKPGIWFIAGDLNATVDAPEIRQLQQMNFLRLCSDKATKRRKKEQSPSIKVDYIFAGPKYYAFDPTLLEEQLQLESQSFSILDEVQISDHSPIIAKFPLLT